MIPYRVRQIWRPGCGKAHIIPNCRTMTRPLTLILLILATLPAMAWGQDDDLAKVKEQELEEVRERISTLKQSMDKSAGSRDRITSELQTAEVEISEQRIRLKELQRERDYSTKRKQELDAQIVQREAELSDEAEALAELGPEAVAQASAIEASR